VEPSAGSNENDLKKPQKGKAKKIASFCFPNPSPNAIVCFPNPLILNKRLALLNAGNLSPPDSVTRRQKGKGGKKNNLILFLSSLIF
jgi:hypothetical protein